MRLSKTQSKILEWLMAYPSVHIGVSGEPFSRKVGNGKPSFTASWASAQARKHMNSVAGDVFGLAKVHPHFVDLEGPTPQITRPTFDFLLRNELIKAVGYWEGRPYVCSIYRFQISDAGQSALLEYSFPDVQAVAP